MSNTSTAEVATADATSPAAGSLAAALAQFQAEIPRIGKGKTARVTSEKGNYSYDFADLADISKVVMPLLGKVGLSFTSKPTIVDNQFVLVYALRHVSGDSDEGVYPLPKAGTPQQVGSAITYARRYTLCAVTGIAPDDADDDGAAAAAAVDYVPQARGGLDRYDPTNQGGRRQGPPRQREIDPAVQEALDEIAELAQHLGIRPAAVARRFAELYGGRDINDGTVAELGPLLYDLRARRDARDETTGHDPDGDTGEGGEAGEQS
jgi:hypothetical protein